MKIAQNYSEIPPLKSPSALIIGSLDGLHLGHLALIHHARNVIAPLGSLAVLTFTNHPSEVFRPSSPVLRLTTLEHKLSLLQKAQVDLVILQEFTQAFSEQSYETFLQTLHSSLPFSYLILGKGATFGKNREGTEEKVHSLSKSLSFQAEYIQKLSLGQNTLSSQSLRTLIFSGDLLQASTLLGRPYSLYGELDCSHIRFPSYLCLPPQGTYPVVLRPHLGKDLFPTTAFLQKESYSLTLPPSTRLSHENSSSLHARDIWEVTFERSQDT